jgi:hypothetical protein
MIKNVVFCKDCKWYVVKRRRENMLSICSNPIANTSFAPFLVDGETFIKAVAARSGNSDCGLDGRLWELKEYEPELEKVMSKWGGT